MIETAPRTWECERLLRRGKQEKHRAVAPERKLIFRKPAAADPKVPQIG